MTFSIRSATKKEVSLLATLISNSFRDVAERFGLTPDNCPTHPSNCTTAWIEKALEEGITYYILEMDGKPCGCAALEQISQKICYLERLAVLPQFRRQGFGKALVNHVCREAKKLGARHVEIGTIAEHTELNEWYKKLGFQLKNTAEFEHLPFRVTFMSKKVAA
jgi:diamine N-acetyltransferase